MIVFIVYEDIVSFFRKRVPSRSDTYNVFINKPFRFTVNKETFSVNREIVDKSFFYYNTKKWLFKPLFTIVYSKLHTCSVDDR